MRLLDMLGKLPRFVVRKGRERYKSGALDLDERTGDLKADGVMANSKRQMRRYA